VYWTRIRFAGGGFYTSAGIYSPAGLSAAVFCVPDEFQISDKFPIGVSSIFAACSYAPQVNLSYGNWDAERSHTGDESLKAIAII
jgi:hypothetical protein